MFRRAARRAWEGGVIHLCRICTGTRLHKGVRCKFCNDKGQPLHWCDRCHTALPLCECFGSYRERTF